MKWLSSIIVFAVASSGSGVGAQDASAQARADLAPTGKLRVAFLPLPHIAVRDKETGQFSGVVVDLSRELAKRLNVPVEFTTVNSNWLPSIRSRKARRILHFLLAYRHWLLKLTLGQPTSSTRRVFSCQQNLRFADWTTSILRDSESLYLRRA